MGKPYDRMLTEFEGTEYNPFDIDGDVKYHYGFASERETFSGHKMRFYLAANPSHLEAVNPVVEGFVKSRQRLCEDESELRFCQFCCMVTLLLLVKVWLPRLNFLS